jgi:hypothetical protein
MNEILVRAYELAAQLADDVRSASTRFEHVRLVARANEAALLAEHLERLLNDDKTEQEPDQTTFH